MTRTNEGKILILTDDDMNCDPKKAKDISKLSILDVGFSASTLKDYDLVVYQGEKGCKILKNKYFKTGVVI